MTGAVLDRPGTSSERAALGGGVTLEERLDAVLAAAREGGAASCPACDGRMSATAGGAECGDCGARLT